MTGLSASNSNRNFGLSFFVVFLALSIFSVSNSSIINCGLCLLALIFLVLAFKKAHWLAPLNKAWMALGSFLQKIVSPLVLTAVFFVFVTPASWLIRSLKPGFFDRKIDILAKTYWKLTQETESIDFNQQF